MVKEVEGGAWLVGVASISCLYVTGYYIMGGVGGGALKYSWMSCSVQIGHETPTRTSDRSFAFSQSGIFVLKKTNAKELNADWLRRTVRTGVEHVERFCEFQTGQRNRRQDPEF